MIPVLRDPLHKYTLTHVLWWWELLLNWLTVLCWPFPTWPVTRWSITANCEIDGLQAVCVAELIEFPHQTPGSGPEHVTIHTHTLRLYLNWQLPYYFCHISGTSEASASPVLHSFPFSSCRVMSRLTSCWPRRFQTQPWCWLIGLWL